ncbi:MAG: serine protease, partial [Pseudomonadota bacterium]
MNWKHTKSSLAYSVTTSDQERAQRLHDYTVTWHEKTEPAYSVRKPDFAVSAAEKRNGARLYTRSNYMDGRWSTIMISAEARDHGYLKAVAASIEVGRGAPIMFTPNGKLEAALEKALAAVEATERADTQTVAKVEPTQPDESERSSGTGTGFFVSADGHVLTNAHVVDGCGVVLVDGAVAIIEETSDLFDLALLKVPARKVRAFAKFAGGPAQLNSDVTIAGYPLSGILSGLNVTRGAVSSLRGLGGDATKLQITAPVQSGNSGGP